MQISSYRNKQIMEHWLVEVRFRKSTFWKENNNNIGKLSSGELSGSSLPSEKAIGFSGPKNL